MKTSSNTVRVINFLIFGFLYFLFALQVVAEDSTNAQARLISNIRSRLPVGWDCVVRQGNDVKQMLHGLGKPEFQVIVSNTNISLVFSTNASTVKMQGPIIPLYFYRQTMKTEIMKTVEKEQVYSWNIPIYFGETEVFVVVTSPAYVNGGLFTLEARKALHPMWKVLRNLIPNREKTTVDELAAEN